MQLQDNGRTTMAHGQRYIALLTEKAWTYDGLAAATGINKRRLAAWIAANREHIRIEDWAPDKNGRPFLPMFRWADGEDTPRPGRRISSAQRMRELRERRKAHGGARVPLP